jgi:fructose-1,6-bisphosphatase/inositol monophosphatase family enzyme
MARRISGVGRVTVSDRKSTHPLAMLSAYVVPVEDPAALLDIAVELAGQAGALLLERLPNRSVGVGTKSSGTDMVSDSDRASERLVSEALARLRPADAVLGEEGSCRDGTTGVRWIIDPLDGTTNYLYGWPAFSVSIGVEVDGEVLAGVVVDPSHNEVFTAVRGQGAHCNGGPIAASDKADVATALVGTGFAYSADRRRRQARVLEWVLPAVRDIRRAGAASIDLCWVACARLDGFYEAGLQPWDRAAGALIAAEAGADTGDLRGGPPSHQMVFAAAPAVTGPLQRLLVDAGALGV